MGLGLDFGGDLSANLSSYLSASWVQEFFVFALYIQNTKLEGVFRREISSLK
jgi:hypothetical protein